MSFSHRHQLTALDRAIAQLLEERARLVSEAEGLPVEAAIEDLLARSSGDFPGDALREVFAAIERGSRSVPQAGGAR